MGGFSGFILIPISNNISFGFTNVIFLTRTDSHRFLMKGVDFSPSKGKVV